MILLDIGHEFPHTPVPNFNRSLFLRPTLKRQCLLLIMLPYNIFFRCSYKAKTTLINRSRKPVQRKTTELIKDNRSGTFIEENCGASRDILDGQLVLLKNKILNHCIIFTPLISHAISKLRKGVLPPCLICIERITDRVKSTVHNTAVLSESIKTYICSIRAIEHPQSQFPLGFLWIPTHSKCNHRSHLSQPIHFCLCLFGSWHRNAWHFTTSSYFSFS